MTKRPEREAQRASAMDRQLRVCANGPRCKLLGPRWQRARSAGVTRRETSDPRGRGVDVKSSLERRLIQALNQHPCRPAELVGCGLRGSRLSAISSKRQAVGAVL